jgi:hypothetical protein
MPTEFATAVSHTGSIRSMPPSRDTSFPVLSDAEGDLRISELERSTTVAALADNGQAQEPLGSLLVKRGLITPEQLEVALQEQKTSGEPLGAIVVARGFAAPATVAQALATQHGGLLKTEYGFATGFNAGGAPPATGAVGEPPVSSPRLGRAGAVVSIAEVKPKVDPAADREAVREELSMASAETEKLNDANERLVAARAELEQRLAQESQRAASLEKELETLRAGNEDLTKWQDAVAQWQAAYGELEQRLTERDTELADLRSSVEACDTVRTELEQGLAAEVERSESLKQELALVERDGPPPAEGASVEGHLVSRISRSPMPGSDLPCAYLVLN